MIHVYRPDSEVCKKTDSLCVAHCKMYIKPIAGTKVLYFGVTKGRVAIFVL